MLYVSRFIGMGKYGVVDTDDGTESIVTHRDLWEYCIDLGMDIKGVMLGETMSRGKPKLCIKRVEVFQDVNQATRDQTKLRVLRGVDVRTHNGEVVGIAVDKGVVANGASVRLSDYGTSCGEYICRTMPYSRGNPLLTVILDDKIKVAGKSFKDFADHGICIDMREVKDKKVFWYICREVASTSRVLLDMDRLVIDERMRMDILTGVAVLQRPANNNPEITNIADIVQYPEVVNRWVAKKFHSEFESISRARFTPVKYDRWATFSREFAGWLAHQGGRSVLNSGDYERLRESNFINIFKVLRELSTSNKSVLQRFENYVKYFKATYDIQRSYIRLCISAGDWLLSYAELKNWI